MPSAPPAATTYGSTTQKPVTAPAWVAAVLTGIQAPINATNVSALQLWAQEEGAQPNRYNGLNTSLDAPGAPVFNSVGVKTYPNFQTGVAATVSTLLEKPTIIAAFRNPNSSLFDIYSGIQRSTYCSTSTCAISNPGYPNTFGFGPGGSGQPSAITSQAAGAQATLTSATVSVGCNAGQGVISLPIVGSILNQCQLKAIKGGLLVGAGGLIMIVGIALVLAKNLGGPLGKVSNVATAALGGDIAARRRINQANVDRANAQANRSSRQSEGAIRASKGQNKEKLEPFPYE